MDTLSHSGSSVLMSACENEDADPNVVELLLNRSTNINRRRRARSIKWYTISNVAKAIIRFTPSSSVLLRQIALESGSTALHHATLRGDMEIVELLLSAGADPTLENDLGQDAAAMCKSYPELQGILQKRERMMKLRGSAKKAAAIEVLGKRISTATPIQHEMWLISLENLLMLYGEGSHGHVMEVHQVLKRETFLTPWHSIPADAEIIFVSTQSPLFCHSLKSQEYHLKLTPSGIPRVALLGTSGPRRISTSCVVSRD